MIIQGNDSYTAASFSLGHRIRRQVWNSVWLLLFRPSPRPLHMWRAFLLRIFGAKLGKGIHVYPAAKIWAPWNLELGDHVGIADGATIYNMDLIKVGRYSVISQGAHLCGGSHDYNSRNFQLYARPIVIGEHVWICAEAFVSLGVSIPDGVVVGARSLVSKSITEPWTVHAGFPAKKISIRTRNDR
ncbi:putative colanic acid biosynthesis acetyltransferase [Pseudomonas sp. BN102]|uniref:putative colanic acid biosynthesis acetyltransferase n=1 Tax=Pseudomonas sp. BN102 TaxID=2567886 RepID=UPI002457547A|nr:putative colanic acid biosynthesis acetyltransferase [Pseudomonas sp. BN102]MDH4610297.1 putative colanic acid biosynthesis acetyltransferase [Pseudomonas sp. BN102]